MPCLSWPQTKVQRLEHTVSSKDQEIKRLSIELARLSTSTGSSASSSSKQPGVPAVPSCLLQCRTDTRLHRLLRLVDMHNLRTHPPRR